MGEYATFLAIPDHVMILRDDATIEVLRSEGEEYRTVASYEVAESPTWTAPILLMDGILVKDRRKLFRWKFINE